MSGTGDAFFFLGYERPLYSLPPPGPALPPRAAQDAPCTSSAVPEDPARSRAVVVAFCDVDDLVRTRLAASARRPPGREARTGAGGTGMRRSRGVAARNRVGAAVSAAGVVAVRRRRRDPRPTLLAPALPPAGSCACCPPRRPWGAGGGIQAAEAGGSLPSRHLPALLPPPPLKKNPSISPWAALLRHQAPPSPDGPDASGGGEESVNR